MTPTCPTADDLSQRILDFIATKGTNKSSIPISTSFERGRWWLWLDVILPGREHYELEATGLTLADAFRNAHHQLIRNLR